MSRTEPKSLGIGSTIWWYDPDRRVYRPSGYGFDGRSSGPPIELEHWREARIVGETARSWLVDPFKRKVNKADLRNGKLAEWACSREEAEHRAWSVTHRYQISERVLHCKDYETLQAIAKLVGYTEPREP